MKVKIMGIKNITKKDGTQSKLIFYCREPLLKEKANVEGLITDSFYLKAEEFSILPTGIKPGVEAELIYDYDGFRSVLSDIKLL